MPTIKARDGAELYVKDWGEGRPVILIHGWPLTADTWDDTAMALADQGMRAIAYDRRGFGRSDQTWTGYDYDSLSDDLSDVVGWTGASNAAIVGFSMGGGEVARYMSRHKARNVTQAALVSSIVPYMLRTNDNPEGTPQEVFDEIASNIKKDRPSFYAGFFRDFFGADDGQDVTEQDIEWACRMSMMAGLKPTLACAQSFAGTDLRPDLQDFKVPTLVIHGTGDKIVPIEPAGRVAAKGIEGAELIEYDEAPHGLFVTHKKRLTADLSAFLRSG